MALKIVKSVSAALTREQAVANAQRAYDKGDLEGAAANLLKALELDQKDAKLFTQLGVILFQQMKYDKALIALRQSLELDPYSTDALNSMGVLMFKLEWYAVAQVFFRRVLELDPTHASAKKSQLETVRKQRASGDSIPPELEDVVKLAKPVEPTISLCMIVKNEEEFLEDCLASVKDLVTEMIIVDTGSTDRTIEIAERYGAKIFHHAWTGDFATARNESLKHATGQWILVLDADETVPAQWHNEVRKAVRNDGNIGYSLVIENLVGKAGHHRQLALIFRLFQNRPDMRYEGIIHEQIVMAAERTGLPQSACTAHIIHRGYLDQYLDQRDKFQRNLAILLEQQKREPEYAYVYFNLGQTYKLLNRAEEAETNYVKALSLLKEQKAAHSTGYYANLYFCLVEHYRNTQQYEKGLELADEAIAIYPTYPDVRFTKGQILMALDRLDEATKCFEECRQFAGIVFAAGNDPTVPTSKTSSALGAIYSRQEQWTQARQQFERALEECGYPDPEILTNLGVSHLNEGNLAKAFEYMTQAAEADENYQRAWINLGSVCYKTGQYEEALAAWRKADEVAPNTPELGHLIGQAALTIGRYQEAQEALERELALSPNLPGLRVQLGIARMGLGHLAEAREALQAEAARAEATDSYGQDARYLEAFLSLLDGASTELPTDAASQRAVEVWTLATEHLLLAERYADAERAIGAMLYLDLAGLAFSVGRLLQQKGLHEAALSFLLKAREEEPENADTYFLIGECAAQGGNEEDARTMYQMALSLNPRLSLARQRLAAMRMPVTTA